MGIMQNSPIHAPISMLNPKKIVDVGCGMNADMTIYSAKCFPDAQIYAIDLAPVSMFKEYIPPNVTFIQGNITKLIDTDPRLASGSVDFLFSRLLASGMQNWREYFKCIASLLRSGGMTEMHDFANFDLMKGETLAFGDAKWFLYETVAKKRALNLHTFNKADVVLKDFGLEDTHIKQYRLTWGAANDECEQVWVSEGRAQWYAALIIFLIGLVADEDRSVQDEILKKFTSARHLRGRVCDFRSMLPGEGSGEGLWHRSVEMR